MISVSAIALLQNLCRYHLDHRLRGKRIVVMDKISGADAQSHFLVD
jgi:hypothetical protein